MVSKTMPEPALRMRICEIPIDIMHIINEYNGTPTAPCPLLFYKKMLDDLEHFQMLPIWRLMNEGIQDIDGEHMGYVKHFTRFFDKFKSINFNYKIACEMAGQKGLIF